MVEWKWQAEEPAIPPDCRVVSIVVDTEAATRLVRVGGIVDVLAIGAETRPTRVATAKVYAWEASAQKSNAHLLVRSDAAKRLVDNAAKCRFNFFFSQRERTEPESSGVSLDELLDPVAP